MAGWTDWVAGIPDRRPEMRRIYFLLPNVQSAKGIIDELLLKRIEWRHIHVLANPGVRLEDLPQATLAQRRDPLPALARGTAAGGVTGMLAGLVALAFSRRAPQRPGARWFLV